MFVLVKKNAMNPSYLSHLTGKPCKQHSCTIDTLINACTTHKQKKTNKMLEGKILLARREDTISSILPSGI